MVKTMAAGVGWGDEFTMVINSLRAAIRCAYVEARAVNRDAGISVMVMMVVMRKSQ